MTLFLSPSEKHALRRILPLLSVNRRALMWAILLSSLGLGSAIALSATSAWLIARASEQPPVLYLLVAATSVRLFGVSRSILRYCQRLASHSIALKGMDSLRQNLYERLAKKRTDSLAMVRRGDLLARTGADVDDVGDLVVKTVLPAATALVVGIGTVVAMSFASVQAAVILLLCFIISGVIAPILSMRSARLAELASRHARTDLSSVTMTILEGATELQVSGQMPTMHRKLTHIEDQLTDATARAAKISGFASGLDRFAMGMAVIGALLVGIPQTDAGLLPGVLLAVIVLTPLASFEGTAELAPACVQLVRSAAAAERISALLDDIPHPETDGENIEIGTAVAAEHDNHTSSPRLTPHDEKPVLRAENLSIGWPGGPVIAENLNFSLSLGETLAVVGPSGIGKTTFIMTLAGMIPPIRGQVTLNDTDVWTVPRNELAQWVSVTAEDAHIFATTVMENLKVADPTLTESTARQLLEKVGLGAWLNSLPNGLNTPLGSAGTTVSGGERRRLLMARALAAPAALMLVDEAGEHLDAQAADDLIRTLFTADSTRGVLVISHRLSALEHAEQVMLMDRDSSGTTTIIDRGTHADILQRHPSYRWAAEQEKL